MGYSREVDQVLIHVKRVATGTTRTVLISARASFRLLTFLMRMKEKGLIASGKSGQFRRFLEKAEGNYTVYNIPLPKERARIVKEMNLLELQMEYSQKHSEKRKLQKEIDHLQKQLPELGQLDKLGFSYYVMPKINGDSQTVQVAVDKRGDQAFKNWFINHLMQGLSGGEKSFEDLKVYTEGNYTIYNLPFEGKELDLSLQDFCTLGINYTVLPDLKVGDHNSQIAIPNADRDKLRNWFQMWKDKQLREGRAAGELYDVDPDSYMETGKTTEAEYIAEAEPIYQKADREFEDRSKKPPWKAKMQKEGSEDYISYMKNDYYEKISIDKKLMEGHKMAGEAVNKKMQENGYIVFRIPGTSGEGEKKLIVLKERVFQAKDEDQYIVFLPKNISCIVGDAKGGIGEMGTADICKAYAWERKGAQNVKNLKRGIEPSGRKAVKRDIKASDIPPIIPKGAAKIKLQPEQKL